ncbi:MAG: hypothetical protein ACKO6Q_01770 [Bacteroidota bacterium]
MLFELWQAPIYRLLIPFSIRFICYEIVHPAPLLCIVVLSGAIAGVLLFGMAPGGWRWHLSWISGFYLLVTCALVGLLYGSLRDLRNRPDWVGHTQPTKRHHLIQFRKEASRTRTGWKCNADVFAIKDSFTNHLSQVASY